jgi:hypothetical protein
VGGIVIIMEMEFKEKVARWKVLADLWITSSKQIFIKDISNNYYFADILKLNDSSITIKCFAPEDRKDMKYDLYWANIITFEEYWGKK